VKLPAVPQAFTAFTVGLLVGILSPLSLRAVSVDQNRVIESMIQILSTDSRQGDKSLKWTFSIQPHKTYVWDRPAPVGAFAHLESGYDMAGRVQSMDFREFDGMRFYASSNVEGLPLDFNIFIGPALVQYRRDQPPLRIGSIWREYYVAFDEFSLAPWESATSDSPVTPDLCCVTALGLDVTASGSPAEATVFLDAVRLVRADGSETVLDDFERQDATEFLYFLQRKLRWKTGADVFP